MTQRQEIAHRPLPVVLKPVATNCFRRGWLGHAAYYGVTGPFFAKWLMLGTRNLSALDHRLGCRRSRVFRKNSAVIRRPHRDDVRRHAEVDPRNSSAGAGPRKFAGPAPIDTPRRTRRGAVPKHWRKAWRITCPVCGTPLSDTNERPTAARPCATPSPFGHLWSEASPVR